MFLTIELLEKYHAPREIIEKFGEKYPEGIDTILFLDENQKNLEDALLRKMLFWGYMSLPSTENEKEKYREVLEIDTSTTVFDSWKVFNSKKVAKSKKVTESEFIYYSADIFDCRHVDSTNDSNSSDYLFFSHDIEESSYISQSFQIRNSTRVVSSWEVIDSQDIMHSNHIRQSMSLYQCRDCHDVYYSSFLVDCHHCLFCHGLVDASFMIFNTQFTPKEFFTIAALVRGHEFSLEPVMSTKRAEKSFEGFRPITVTNEFSHYSKMTQEDFDFLYSLPHYSEWVVYQITMNNKAFRDLKKF